MNDCFRHSIEILRSLIFMEQLRLNIVILTAPLFVCFAENHKTISN